mmetsp:Transcript_40256/g.71903  ORF Transcript_40256/g.71903 Transcript_40256/m.71903 type:complete len:214 (+) Transcript_40256:2105-2746(+)
MHHCGPRRSRPPSQRPRSQHRPQCLTRSPRPVSGPPGTPTLKCLVPTLGSGCPSINCSTETETGAACPSPGWSSRRLIIRSTSRSTTRGCPTTRTTRNHPRTRHTTLPSQHPGGPPGLPPRMGLRPGPAPSPSTSAKPGAAPAHRQPQQIVICPARQQFSTGMPGAWWAGRTTPMHTSSPCYPPVSVPSSGGTEPKPDVCGRTVSQVKRPVFA